MHSNAAVTCRALLMVACAIAIPAVAIFGKSLPDFLWEQCHRLAIAESASTAKPADSRSPRYGGAKPTPELTGFELPKSCSWQDLNQGGGDAIRAEAQVSGAVPPAGPSGECIYALLEKVAPQTTSVAAAPANPAPANDQFTAIQRRLRELGATWYALETWGDEGRFHFTCRVSVYGNPSLNRLFQASDAEAIQAMANVLQQVERWKTTRE